MAGLAALLAVLALGALHRPAYERLSFLAFDAYQRLLPREEAGAPVAVVDIDEASIAALGQWPWPRTTIAEMVDRLAGLGAAAIAFDVVFPEADRTSLSTLIEPLRRAGVEVNLPEGQDAIDNDAELAAAFARHNVIAGIVISNETEGQLPPPKSGFAFGGTDPLAYLEPFRGGVANLPRLTEAATGLGFFSFPPAPDGLVRAIPLLAAAQGRLYPGLAMEALRVAQGASGFAVRSTGASGESDTGQAAMTTVRVGTLDVPTTADGALWVYYARDTSFPVVSAREILDPELAARVAEDVAGRIILVGTSAVGLRDIVATPKGRSMAGVFVHAEIIDQIVGQTFLSRPDWAVGAELLGAGVLGLLLLTVAQRGHALLTAAAATALAGVALAASWWAFATERLLIDPLLPMAAVALVFAVTMPLLLLLTDRERRFVREAFSHYLAPSLVERLAEDPRALTLGGDLRELTVLFADVRGFTTLSEKMDPTELTALLNDFLTPMTDVLLDAEATIDKYMGDAVMAFWNAPLDIADHQRKACLAALEMMRALDRFNAGRARPIQIGIGLNSGPCCVGNLGSRQRFSYSAIGDEVNVASRLQNLTKTFGVPILATASTRREAASLAFLEVDLVPLRGRAERVEVFALVGDETYAASSSFQALLGEHSAFLAAHRAGETSAALSSLDRLEAMATEAVVPLYRHFRDRMAAQERTST